MLISFSYKKAQTVVTGIKLINKFRIDDASQPVSKTWQMMESIIFIWWLFVADSQIDGLNFHDIEIATGFGDHTHTHTYPRT